MFGINKFWIWLAILGATAYYNPQWLIFVWLGGVAYAAMWIMFGGPKQMQLNEGTWVKSINQVNGMTQIVITGGKDESIQQFTSSRVEVSGNIISIY